jgi:two-component system, NtrC family, sensor kinase
MAQSSPESPSSEIQALPPNARLRRALAAEHESGSFQAASGLDGVERLYAFRKVGHYPIFVTYGIGVDAVLQRWREDLVIDAGIFGLAVMALVLTALSALRRARQEELAVRRWQAAAAQVREEAERRLAAEEQLHQAQKMEALGQLTGSISHDFNNLLTAVIGNLEMLRGRQRDPHEERKVTDALLAAERGEKAIRSLLAFARRQPLQAEVFDLNAAVRGMETLCRQSIPSTVRLIFDLARDLRPVEADVNQTELAVLNLVVNARDAMPGGGTLRLTTANVTLRGEPDGRVGEFVALAVVDTGTGIPPETLGRIFEPFFTTKPKGKGTGLGLSQVYGFARQSGGAVTVASEVGHGTTITLYLPTCMPAALRRGSAA